MALFFCTGIDDILAYSNLIMAKGSWLAICIGVLVATLVSLIIAAHLSDKLKNFKQVSVNNSLLQTIQQSLGFYRDILHFR